MGFAAHNGLIVTGSTNVRIGQQPAARVGDTIVCQQHGPSSISAGSSTVRINGRAAARFGDPTACLVPGLPTESRVLGPPSAPAQASTLPAAVPPRAAPAPDTPAMLPQAATEAPPTRMEKARRFFGYSRVGNVLKMARYTNRVKRTLFPVNTPAGGSNFQSWDLLYYDLMAAYRLPFNQDRSNQNPSSDAEQGQANNVPHPAQSTVQMPSIESKAEAGLVKVNFGPIFRRANFSSVLAGIEANIGHVKGELDWLVLFDDHRTGFSLRGETTGEAAKVELQPGYTFYATPPTFMHPLIRRVAGEVSDIKVETKLKVSWAYLQGTYKAALWGFKDDRKDYVTMGVAGSPGLVEQALRLPAFLRGYIPGIDLE